MKRFVSPLSRVSRLRHQQTLQAELIVSRCASEHALCVQRLQRLDEQLRQIEHGRLAAWRSGCGLEAALSADLLGQSLRGSRDQADRARAQSAAALSAALQGYANCHSRERLADTLLQQHQAEHRREQTRAEEIELSEQAQQHSKREDGR